MALPISEIPQPEDDTILSDEQAYTLIKSLVAELDSETDAMNEKRSYYEGEQELKYATLEFKRAFGEEFGDLVANWCEVAISATEDRLEMDRVVFRPGELEPIDENVTEAIWKIMLQNNIDELENELYSSSMIESRSSVIVWPGQEDDDQDVLVSANRAQTVYVVYEDDNPRRPLMAIKKWRTQVGQVNLNLYTPQYVYKYMAPKQYADYNNDLFDAQTFDTSGWMKREPSETNDPTWPLENPFSQIPIVEFRARRNRSELQNLTPIQDAVNKLLINMLVAADYAAHSQSYIVSTNQPPEGGWKRRPGEVWQIQPEVDLDGKALPTSVGSLPAEDPSNFIAVIEHLLAQFSNLSATPGYYIFNSNSQSGRGDAPSGDSLKISETTLMKKVQKYQQMYENPLVRVGQLIYEALVFRDIESGEIPEYGQVLWTNPQKHFMGMLLEEGRKMIDELGLPPKYAWEHIGLTEAEIKDAQEWYDKQKAEALAFEESKLNKDTDEAGIPRKTAEQQKTGSTSKTT